MTLLASSTADLIDSIGNLVGAVAWPLAVVVVVIVFRERLGALLRVITKRAESDDVTFKLGPIQFSAVARSAARIGAAAARRAASGSLGSADVDEAVDASASAVASFASHAGSWIAASPRILWVDNTPQNNVYERQAFEALGIEVVTRTSTEEAQDLLKTQRFDVIISNMGRPPDNQAGYTLLARLPERNRTTPFIVYSSSNLPQHKQMASERGALGATNNPSELFALVEEALTPGSTG